MIIWYIMHSRKKVKNATSAASFNFEISYFFDKSTVTEDIVLYVT